MGRRRNSHFWTPVDPSALKILHVPQPGLYLALLYIGISVVYNARVAFCLRKVAPRGGLRGVLRPRPFSALTVLRNSHFHVARRSLRIIRPLFTFKLRTCDRPLAKNAISHLMYRRLYGSAIPHTPKRRALRFRRFFKFPYVSPCRVAIFIKAGNL